MHRNVDVLACGGTDVKPRESCHHEERLSATRDLLFVAPENRFLLALRGSW